MQELTRLQNERVILMGNEAIVRGALESGVQFVSTYPGTPASEIGNLFSEIAKNNDSIYFEFSTNEKTALEAAIGASFSGLKCLVAMKNFGMNVALESLIPFGYTGSKGATVIIVADDPSCHSSAQSEENSRGFAYLSHIPVLEPSDAQECLEFVRLGFQISKRFHLPVIVRTTTRVAHQKAVVQTSGLPKVRPSDAEFIKDKHRFVTMPPRVMEMHQELLDKISIIKLFVEDSDVNYVYGDLSTNTNTKRAGIITSGVAYLHVLEALRMLGKDVPVLKLGFFYPLPEQKIKDFIKPLKKVLIVEELDPYLEKEVAALAKSANPKLVIYGKNILPETGEMNPEIVAGAVAAVVRKKYVVPQSMVEGVKHFPRFCSGAATCPYWRVFAAIKKAVPENTVFGGDIGCYMIAALPPHNLYDYMFCMGSSIGIGHGIAKATNGQQKVVTLIGDGTFFHSGIEALLNAVYNQSNLLAIIVDNRITAMTGHQPNPGMGKAAETDAAPEIKIEEVARALGVKNIKIVDPVDGFDELVTSIQEYYPKNEISVIIAKRICALLEKRQKQ
ncbi:MAG: thiamine pyrophosphate-dependent enzyme [Candidatus Pacebacteria bacterium]|nr:thiamine pyrophosphate-dependent enzyme [Candidatus Paceibacterota bacterium]